MRRKEAAVRRRSEEYRATVRKYNREYQRARRARKAAESE